MMDYYLYFLVAVILLIGKNILLFHPNITIYNFRVKGYKWIERLFKRPKKNVFGNTYDPNTISIIGIVNLIVYFLPFFIIVLPLAILNNFFDINLIPMYKGADKFTLYIIFAYVSYFISDSIFSIYHRISSKKQLKNLYLIRNKNKKTIVLIIVLLYFVNIIIFTYFINFKFVIWYTLISVLIQLLIAYIFKLVFFKSNYIWDILVVEDKVVLKKLSSEILLESSQISGFYFDNSKKTYYLEISTNNYEQKNDELLKKISEL